MGFVVEPRSKFCVEMKSFTDVHCIYQYRSGLRLLREAPPALGRNGATSLGVRGALVTEFLYYILNTADSKSFCITCSTPGAGGREAVGPQGRGTVGPLRAREREDRQFLVQLVQEEIKAASQYDKASSKIRHGKSSACPRADTTPTSSSSRILAVAEKSNSPTTSPETESKNRGVVEDCGHETVGGSPSSHTKEITASHRSSCKSSGGSNNHGGIMSATNRKSPDMMEDDVAESGGLLAPAPLAVSVFGFDELVHGNAKQPEQSRDRLLALLHCSEKSGSSCSTTIAAKDALAIAGQRSSKNSTPPTASDSCSAGISSDQKSIEQDTLPGGFSDSRMSSISRTPPPTTSTWGGSASSASGLNNLNLPDGRGEMLGKGFSSTIGDASTAEPGCCTSSEKSAVFGSPCLSGSVSDHSNPLYLIDRDVGRVFDSAAVETESRGGGSASRQELCHSRAPSSPDLGCNCNESVDLLGGGKNAGEGIFTQPASMRQEGITQPTCSSTLERKYASSSRTRSPLLPDRTRERAATAEETRRTFVSDVFSPLFSRGSKGSSEKKTDYIPTRKGSMPATMSTSQQAESPNSKSTQQITITNVAAGGESSKERGQSSSWTASLGKIGAFPFRRTAGRMQRSRSPPLARKKTSPHERRHKQVPDPGIFTKVLSLGQHLRNSKTTLSTGQRPLISLGQPGQWESNIDSPTCTAKLERIEALRQSYAQEALKRLSGGVMIGRDETQQISGTTQLQAAPGPRASGSVEGGSAWGIVSDDVDNGRAFDLSKAPAREQQLLPLQVQQLQQQVSLVRDYCPLAFKRVLRRVLQRADREAHKLAQELAERRRLGLRGTTRQAGAASSLPSSDVEMQATRGRSSGRMGGVRLMSTRNFRSSRQVLLEKFLHTSPLRYIGSALSSGEKLFRAVCFRSNSSLFMSSSIQNGQQKMKGGGGSTRGVPGRVHQEDATKKMQEYAKKMQDWDRQQLLLESRRGKSGGRATQVQGRERDEVLSFSLRSLFVCQGSKMDVVQSVEDRKGKVGRCVRSLR